MKRLNSIAKGVTLIELMVTITVVAIFAPLLYSSISNIYHKYYTVSRRTETVLEGIKIKRIMDIYWNDIDSVSSITPSQISYYDISGNVQELSLVHGQLRKGNRLISDRITAGIFSYEKVDCSPRKILVWEMEVQGVWVSGAK